MYVSREIINTKFKHFFFRSYIRFKYFVCMLSKYFR